jgi:hypothetical protein
MRMRTCPAPGATTGLSTSRKVPGVGISTALYVFSIVVSYRCAGIALSLFTGISRVAIVWITQACCRKGKPPAILKRLKRWNLCWRVILTFQENP